MIDRIRALFIVVEEGSVNRAALRLRISQPALSRQMKTLEHELGGTLLERETSGVKPTALGHTLMKTMRPVLDAYESALTEVRRHARGLKSELRVGYLISAGQSVLTPALTGLRKSRPDLKLKLHDMSPKEQKITSGRDAISSALSINSSGVTQTGQPGPCTSSISGGSN